MTLENKMNAQQRLSSALGANIFEVELLRDQVEQLTVQLAERDATIALLTVVNPDDQ